MGHLKNQVTELIQAYGPLFTLWFDVPQEVGPDLGRPVVERVRHLQPGLVINNRAYRDPGKPVGDYDTPEQRVGGFNRERPWETCMTICQQWAWKPSDRLKSLERTTWMSRSTPEPSGSSLNAKTASLRTSLSGSSVTA